MYKSKLLGNLNLKKGFERILKNSREMCGSTNQDVTFQATKNAGIITLNRPKALNALNLAMVNKIYAHLKKWENEKLFVIIKGSGRAFCSGKDIKSAAHAQLFGETNSHPLFRNEYTMNNLIATYRIPYIALIDGIVMGGGVGISVHGSYRIATEKTLFAMPEASIGLFPDVGTTHFLSRLMGHLGKYLALTGTRLKGIDVANTGIATHFCRSVKLKQLESALLKCQEISDIPNAVQKFCECDRCEFHLKSILPNINKCFSAATVEDIISELKLDGSEWALKTISVMSKMSPTSLKLTHKALTLGSKLTLQECLQMEYRLARSCLANSDFYEGVRAVLVDKDHKPKWKPNTISQVTNETLKEYFKKLPEELELQL